jgi:short chain dehydrogenase
VCDKLGPIQVLVNCAGIEAFEPFQSITEASWDRIMAVNLKGTLNCTQAVVSDMIEAGWGRIINISSSSAQSGAAKMTHYAASKAGVIGFTKALALETRSRGHHRQHNSPRQHRHAHAPSSCGSGSSGRGRSRTGRGDYARGPRRETRRHRGGVRVSRLRGGRLYNGPGGRCERRAIHVKQSSVPSPDCSARTHAEPARR